MEFDVLLKTESSRLISVLRYGIFFQERLTPCKWKFFTGNPDCSCTNIIIMYLTLTCTNNVFCFQETALEVFLSDGHNHFLVFPKSVRNKVYDK